MNCPKCKSTDLSWLKPAVNEHAGDALEIYFCCRECGAEHYALVPFNSFISIDS